MPIYTMVLQDGYSRMLWDADHVRTLVGEHNIDHRIDINSSPIAHSGVFKEPVRVSFDNTHPDCKDRVRGDITVQEGRLYLNQKAYRILSSVVEKDGDFIEVIDEANEIGYVYTPLRVAEDIDAVNTSLTKIDEWGDPEHLAFHEEKVKNWAIFRCELDSYMSVQCNEAVKIAIEKAELCGIFFTPDIGNRYSNQFDEGVTTKN